MDSNQNSYPPYAPYNYPPPNQPNLDMYQPPTQFRHSSQLQYPQPAYLPTPYSDPSQTHPPTYPNPNLSQNDSSLYPHPQSFSVHNIQRDYYDNLNLQPGLAQNSSSFHHIGGDCYGKSNHSHYPYSSSSASTLSIHDGLAYMQISNNQPEHPPPVAITLPHHQRYDSFSSYSGSPVSTPTTSPFSKSHHGGTFSASQHSGGQIMAYTGSPSGKGNSSLKVVLLHGNLEIFVRYARNLPNKDVLPKIHMSNFISRGIQKVGGPTTSDPYVTVSLAYAVIARTYVINNNKNPEWGQHFYVPVAHEAAMLLFTVKYNDMFGAHIVGTVSIPAETIFSGEKIDGIYPVLGSNGEPCNQGAILSFWIQYIPVSRLTMYHHGVSVGTDCKGVLNTYFSLRRGGKVTLYQDAHVPNNSLPTLWLENGVQYKHGQCWRDVFDAINGARRLIYIVGWSFFHKITLVRDGGEGNMVMLGDLLKRKSQEGVRVCLLIWDDPSSWSILNNVSFSLCV